MKLIKTHWKKLIGVIAVIAVLVFAYWYGGSAPGSRGFVTTEQTEEASEEQVSEEISSVVDAQVSEEPAGSETYSSEDAEVTEDQADTETSSEDDTDVSEETTDAEASSEKTAEVTEEATGQTTQSDEDTQTSKGSADAEISSTGSSSGGNGSSSGSSSGSSGSSNGSSSGSSGSSGSGGSSGSSGSSNDSNSGSSGSNDSEAATDSAGQCTISISCATILNNMSLLDSAKTSIIPSDGCILQTATIDIEDGDTVFDILSKATRKYGISLEYSYTAIYGSYYIEGIANIYEFDCGELSGWMYSVNGSFPSYGCSKYAVSDGDTIKWVYTCDLGADVGNPY